LVLQPDYTREERLAHLNLHHYMDSIVPQKGFV